MFSKLYSSLCEEVLRMAVAWRGTKQQRLAKSVVRSKRFISRLEARELKDNLRSLGFGSYAAYQRSRLWRAIRGRVMERDNGKCRRCGRQAQAVHHDSYDIATLKGESLVHLHCVCGKCHKACHKTRWAKRPQDVK